MNLRRLRLDSKLRELTAEVSIDYRKFVQPLFVAQTIDTRTSIPGMTGVFRETPNSLLQQVERDLEAGISKFLLFGIPATKATHHFDHSFTVGQIEALKQRFGKDIWLAVDVCLCSHTPHGHCGILSPEHDQVLNAPSVAEIARTALSYAQAGADCVAPSDMMDGRIRAIRQALDEANLTQTVLMSYAAKFSSRFYGPFRIAADSSPKGDLQIKDRASYQLSPARYSDALASAMRDFEEGADILMVKPGLPYLDVLSRLSAEIPTVPWTVYEVGGEWAAIEVLASQGLIDAKLGHLEVWTGFFRAGAQFVISYGSRYAREWLS